MSEKTEVVRLTLSSDLASSVSSFIKDYPDVDIVENRMMYNAFGTENLPKYAYALSGTLSALAAVIIAYGKAKKKKIKIHHLFGKSLIVDSEGHSSEEVCKMLDKAIAFSEIEK